MWHSSYLAIDTLLSLLLFSNKTKIPKADDINDFSDKPSDGDFALEIILILIFNCVYSVIKMYLI